MRINGFSYRKSVFKFSGSSVRPAYPGFIVMNKPTDVFRGIVSPKNSNVFFLDFTAS